MSTKPQLRQHYRAARDALAPRDVVEKSRLIITRLMQLHAMSEGESFFIYVSVGSEVQTHDLIAMLLARGKIVTVPLVTGPGVMEAHRIHDVRELSPGKYNIPAPVRANLHDTCVDVCIAPGLAFTDTGLRLGSGGGYYDRYLAKNPARCAIGLAYELQIAPDLPIDENDRRVDRIVTEQRTIAIET